MELQKLEAKPRATLGKKVKQLRRASLLPAVMYGEGVEPTPIELDAKKAGAVLARAGAATLIELKLGRKTHNVLVREVQRDWISMEPLHVDFLAVAMDIAIRTMVRIELVGEPPAVSEQGGVLVTGLSEIEVEALPSDLPDRLTVDLESLAEIGEMILVGSLPTGDGVKVLTDPDELVARVIFQVEEVVEEEEEIEPEVAEPEVIERGRPEEEEAEAEEEE